MALVYKHDLSFLSKRSPLSFQFSSVFSGLFSSAKEKYYFLYYIKQLNVKIGNFIILWKYAIYSFTSAESKTYAAFSSLNSS